MNYYWSAIIDNPNHTFVIAEAGSNWKIGTFEEDLQQAKKLIHIASKCGADAVKFQTYRSKSVYALKAGKSKYLLKQGIDDDINELFDKFSMPYKMIPELSDYCKKEKILFMSTPFSVEDAKQIDPFVSIHKVASYEINHVRLLEFLASTGKPIILSTGASTYDDIDFAMEILKNHNVSKIGILQCTSKYPANFTSLNLNVIPNLKSRYGVTVGLSDHSENPFIAPIMAVGLGATIIEKHFTLDRNLPGPDHAFALIPEELTLMIDSIRNADLAKGTGQKEILEEEKELHEFATRSIQAISKIKKGDILKEGFNFEILRPGEQNRGLDAKFLNQVNGKRSIKDLDAGEGITDFMWYFLQIY